MENIPLPSTTGSLWTILILCILITVILIAFRRGGFLIKLITGLAILGLLAMILNLLPVNGAVQLLILSVAVTSLSAGMIDKDGDNRFSVQNVVSIILVIVGILSAIYWLSVATGTDFDGTLLEALRSGWATIRSVFSSGELVYDQQVKP